MQSSIWRFVMSLPNPKPIAREVHERLPGLSRFILKCWLLGRAWARALLESLGIPFTEKEFFEKVNARDHKTVELLLIAGINAWSWSSHETGLIIASANCDLEMVRLLLNRYPRKRDDRIREVNREIALPSGDGINALFTARLASKRTVRGAYEAEQICDELKAVGASDSLFYDADLLAALEKKDRRAAEDALERKANPNRRDEHGCPALLIAIEQENADIADVLITHGADVSRKGPDGTPALPRAVRRGMTELVDSLLRHGADPNLRDEAGRPILCTAIQDGRADLAKLLARAGDVNLSGPNGATALMLAVRKKMGGVVETLLDRGADPNRRDDAGWHALAIAIEGESLDIVELVLGRGANVNLAGPGGTTPLMLAARKGVMEPVESLLRHGADPNLRDEAGRPILYAAIQDGRVDLAKLLARAGDVNLPGPDGATALMLAVRRKMGDIVEILLDRGADPNRRDDAGWHALAIAIEGESLDIVELALGRGANVNLAGPGGTTPLMLAAQKGMAPLVKDLLARGADRNAKDDSGATALSYATQNQRRDVELLLSPPISPGDPGSALLRAAQRGDEAEVRRLALSGDPDPRDAGRNTPLMLAAARGHVAAVNALLDAHAAVEASNSEGDTPLILAARFGRLNVVEALKPRCITPGEPNAKGDTALIEAARAGHANVVRALLTLGDRAGVNHVGKKSRSALILAAARQHVEVVEALLAPELDADVNRADAEGRTALIEACHAGSLGIVLMLLDRGADASLRTGGDCTAWMAARLAGRTEICESLGAKGRYGEAEAGLFEAARNGDAESARSILRGDVKPEAMNLEGRTALMEAIEWGRSNVAQALLETGRVDAGRRSGDVSALSLAALHGRKDAMEVLVPHLLKSKLGKNDVPDALVCAARRGHADVVRILIERLGASPNHVCDERGQTLLHIAAAEGYAALAKVLLDLGADRTLQDKQGNTPMTTAICRQQMDLASLLATNSSDADGARLIVAIRSGNRVLVESLLSRGASLSARDPDGMSPLMAACERRRSEIVGDLLAQMDGQALRAQLSCTDIRRRTPLMWAVIGGDARCVQLILDKGPPLDEADDSGRTALHWALEGGHEPVAKSLIAHGANVQTASNALRTPVMEAARRGHTGAVKAILGRFQDRDELRRHLDLTDKDGHSALKEALIHERHEVASILKPRGASVGRLEGLLFAAAARGDNAVLKTVIAQASEIDVRDENRRTALMAAAAFGYEETLTILLDAGADVNATDVHGVSALSLAARGGHAGAVGELLDKGAGVNAQDNSGATPLIEAAFGGRMAIAGALLDRRANANVRDKQGRFPLMMAAAAGAASLVERLVREGGADVDAVDADGRTPLMVAHLDPRLADTEAKLKALGAKRGLEDADLILAARNGEERQALELIGKASVTISDLNGDTALLESARSGSAGIAAALAAVGAPVNARNRHGRTPLMEAARVGAADVAQALFSAGEQVQVDLHDEDGDTALHAVCLAAGPGPDAGRLALLNSMLARRSRILVRNHKGRDPLMAAAVNGNLAIVQRLLEELNGAAADQKEGVLLSLDVNGRSARELARAAGHEDCAQTIEQAMRTVPHGQFVGTTLSGECYHRLSCADYRRSLSARDPSSQKTISAAQMMGLRSCLHCIRSHS